MKRSTLDDFVTTSPESDRDDEATDGEQSRDGESVSESGAEGAASNESADRPTITFAGGAQRACATCDRVTTRQWRTDDGLVCPACVDW